MYKPSAPICYDGEYNDVTGEIRLHWDAPFDDGCSQILDYRVFYKRKTCSIEEHCDDCTINEYQIYRTDVPIDTTSLVINDLKRFPLLEADQAYQFVF